MLLLLLALLWDDERLEVASEFDRGENQRLDGMQLSNTTRRLGAIEFSLLFLTLDLNAQMIKAASTKLKKSTDVEGQKQIFVC